MKMPLNAQKPGSKIMFRSGQTIVGLGYDCRDEYMYWTDVSGRTINRANIDGSDVQVIVGRGKWRVKWFKPGSYFLRMRCKFDVNFTSQLCFCCQFARESSTSQLLQIMSLRISGVNIRFAFVGSMYGALDSPDRRHLYNQLWFCFYSGSLSKCK